MQNKTKTIKEDTKNKQTITLYFRKFNYFRRFFLVVMSISLSESVCVCVCVYVNVCVLQVCMFVMIVIFKINNRGSTIRIEFDAKDDI